jgi:hypothetical protein
MQCYRLYFVDLTTGRVKNVQEFEAENDGSAMVEADRLRGDGPMELWCQARRIVKWPALL